MLLEFWKILSQCLFKYYLSHIFCSLLLVLDELYFDHLSVNSLSYFPFKILDDSLEASSRSVSFFFSPV